MFPGLLILLEVLASFYRSFCSGPAQIATEMQGRRVARGNGVSGYLKKDHAGRRTLSFRRRLRMSRSLPMVRSMDFFPRQYSSLSHDHQHFSCELVLALLEHLHRLEPIRFR